MNDGISIHEELMGCEVSMERIQKRKNTLSE